MRPFKPAVGVVPTSSSSGSSVDKCEKKEIVIHVVEIHGTEFKPDFLKILKGQYVEWRVSSKNIGPDDLAKPKTHIIGFNDGA